MPLKALIVEDEIRSREFLRSLVQEFCPSVQLAGTASTVAEAVEKINALQPDLLFLDIEMHAGTGFDVLQQAAHQQMHVIFTTAYDHYAIKAIKFSAADYLLKPIDVDELLLAVQKVEEKWKGGNQQHILHQLLHNLQKQPAQEYSVTLATSEGLEFVPLAQIIRLEASGPYTHFYLKDGEKLVISKNLKEYENLLSDHQFFRVHNSHMINLREVKRLMKTDGGYAVMSDDSMITISPKKKEEFMAQLAQRMV